MKLYLDLIFLLNLWFDSLLLMTVSILLKRNIKIKNIFLGSSIGSLTFFLLFFKGNNISLFLLKIVVSFLMIIVTFSFKNLKYFLTNLGYFYLVSIILGGGMYLLKDLFSYQHNGLIFYSNGYQMNYIILLIISPIILIIYLKSTSKLKNNYHNYHKVDFLYKQKLYHLNGYLDTGNNLVDPYKKRSIILISLNLNINLENIIYTPYETLNHNGLIKCFKPEKVFVDKKEFSNYLIGLSEKKFKIEGIDCILPNTMKGKIE